MRLDLSQPVRPLKPSRRSLTGRVSIDSGSRVGFESSLERDWLTAMDFDPTVRLIREQPFSFYYELEGERRRYTPDILVESVSSHGVVSTVVYEVKLLEELRAEWLRYRPRFKAAVHYCRARGWRFKIVTEREIRTPFLKNAKFLRRYRTMQPQPLIAQQLLYTLKALGETTPQALLAAAYLSSETRMGAIPQLWRLVALRQIGTMLDEALTMQSPIWLQGD